MACDFKGDSHPHTSAVLCDEPDNEVVLRCLPQIDEYLAAEGARACTRSGKRAAHSKSLLTLAEAAEEEDESGEEEDDDDDDDDDDSDDSDDSEDGDDDEEAADGGGGEARKACNGASGAAKPAAKPAATQACLRAASDSAASAARPGAPATAPAAAASASSLERVEQLRAALGDQPAPPPSDVELKRALRGLVLTLVPPEEKVGAPKR